MSLKMTRGDKMTLREERIKKGLTQVQLADAVGVNRSTIAMIENGTNNPSVELAKRIGQYLNVPWSNFFEQK